MTPPASPSMPSVGGGGRWGVGRIPAPRRPIARPSLLVSDRDDRYSVRRHPVVDGEGKPLDQDATGSTFCLWIPRRCFAESLNGRREFTEECGCGKYAAFFVQAWASSTSPSAAGWNSTFIEPVEKPLPDVFPRNRLYPTRVEFGDAAFDFGRPRRFDAFIGLSFERFEEQPCQVRAVLFGQFRRFLPQVDECPAHDVILRPAPDWRPAYPRPTRRREAIGYGSRATEACRSFSGLTPAAQPRRTR